MKNIKTNSNLGKIIPFLLLFVFIFAGYSLRAQNDDGESTAESMKMDFGGKFGTTISQFTNQQPYTNNAQGITGGGFFRLHFHKLFGVQAEINYSQQGGRITNFEVPGYYGIDNNWYDLKVENQYLRLHKIEIPILGEFSYKLKDTKVKVNLGPAFSYNAHSGIHSEGTAISGLEFHTYTGEENVTSKINSYEFAAIGGIGFEFDVSNSIFLTVDARYKYGFNPVYEGFSYIGIPQIQGDLKNHSFSFTIGCGFYKSEIFK